MPASQTFHVLIIGAGLGGLTLAQSLRRSGVSFELFERDRSPFDRPQGYRLHLDADAIHACAEVLPPDLHALFDATAQRTKSLTTILNTDLSVLKRLPTPDEDDASVWGSGAAPAGHRNVDRATLRQILLAEVEDHVRYGKTLERFENDAEGVTAVFSDGSTARGAVLVGADGIRSAVRRQRAPGVDTADAGVSAIYGRVPITAARSLAPDAALEDSFAIASDERKVFLGLGSVRFPTPPQVAAKRLVQGVSMRAQHDYLVCIVGGRREHFPADLPHRAGAELQRIAVETLSDWPDGAARLVGAGEADAFFAVDMYTSVPFAIDPPSNVTLLGDAVHAMTPTLGRGANLAMRDGTLLGRALKAAAAGEAALAEALGRYERDMLAYGFTVVREAAEVGRQRMAQNPLPA